MKINKDLYDLHLAFLPKELNGKVKLDDTESPKQPRKNTEHDEQVQFFKALDKLALKEPGLRFAFAVPNGSARNVVTGARLKQEGVKRGVPDIVIPLPKGIYHGLFIEMKAGKNKMSDFQKEYFSYLEGVGYKCCCCYSSDEAVSEVISYIGAKNE